MRVLVAYDASPGADEALRDLTRAGLPTSGSVRVVAVGADVAGPADPSAAASNFATLGGSDRRHVALDHVRALAVHGEAVAAALLPGWSVTHVSRLAATCDALLGEVRAFAADLAVLGAHTRRPAVAGPAFGSVARRIVAEAPCSVRVGRRARDAGASHAPVLVIGYDGSAGADAAVEAVAERVWPAGTSVHVVVVVDPVAAEDDPEWIPWRWLRERTSASAAQLASAGLTATHDLVTGDPRRVLPEAAAARGADAVFVGARGGTGATHTLMGSVASSVVARSPCSVEVVRRVARQSEPSSGVPAG